MIPHFGLSLAKPLILFVAYFKRDASPALTTKDRDHIIRERHADGETISDLAREYGVSPQRIFQIVKGMPISCK